MVVPDLARLCKNLTRAGFDIHKMFRVSWYNQIIPDDLCLPCYNNEDSFGLVVGNTKHLWDIFPQYVRSLPDIPFNPLDDYTMATTSQIMKKWGENNPSIPYVIRWVHDTHPARVVAVQKLAHVTGLAYHCTDSHLSIHNTYGPWIAFRAVILFNYNDTSVMKIQPKLGHPDEKSQLPMQQAMKSALENPGEWRSWLAVRDACELGKEHRYTEKQIRYHYTKDSSVF